MKTTSGSLNVARWLADKATAVKPKMNILK